MHRGEFKSSKAMRKIICSPSLERYKRSAAAAFVANDNFSKNIVVIIYTEKISLI